MAEPEWQRLLRNPAFEFVCPCGLRVEPFRDPHGRGHNVRARRGEEGLHTDTCPVVHGELGLRAVEGGQVIYSEGMFGPRGSRGLVKPPTTAGAGDTSVWYGDFTHLMNRTLAETSLSLMAALNRNSTGPLRNPSHEELSRAIGEALHEPLLIDEISPVEAAQRAGVGIYWGISRDPLVHRIHAMRYQTQDDYFEGRDVWNPKGKIQTRIRFRIGLPVAKDVRGKVWQYDRIIQPPYLFFLTATSDGMTQQITIVPLAEHGYGVPWLSKESDPEGEMLRQVRSAIPSVGLIKSAVHADMSLLGPLWPHRLDRNGRLPCRPDLIVLGRRGTAIFQLEGAKDRLYRQGVQRTLHELRDFLDTPSLLIRSVTLDELRSAAPAYLSEIRALS